MQASQSTKASDSIHSDPPVLREVPSVRPRDLSSHLATPILFGPIQAARKYLERQRSGGSPVASPADSPVDGSSAVCGGLPGQARAAGTAAGEAGDPFALTARGREQTLSEEGGNERERRERQEWERRERQERELLEQARREQDRRLERSLYEGHSIEAGLSFDEAGETASDELAALNGGGRSESLYLYAGPAEEPQPAPDPLAVRGAILRLAREAGAIPEAGRANAPQAALSRPEDAAAASNPVVSPAFLKTPPAPEGNHSYAAFADVARRVWNEARIPEDNPYSRPPQQREEEREQGWNAPPFGPRSTGLAGDGQAAEYRDPRNEEERSTELADSRAVAKPQPWDRAPGYRAIGGGDPFAPSAHPPSQQQSSQQQSSVQQSSVQQSSVQQSSWLTDTGSSEELQPQPPAAPSPAIQSPAAQPLAARAGRIVSALEGDALAHDACNLLSAITLYSELLGSPGVLEERHRHYAEELRLVASRSQSLIGRLLGWGEAEVARRCGEPAAASGPDALGTGRAQTTAGCATNSAASVAAATVPGVTTPEHEVRRLPSTGGDGSPAALDGAGGAVAGGPLNLPPSTAYSFASGTGPAREDWIEDTPMEGQPARRERIPENLTPAVPACLQSSAAPARQETLIDGIRRPEFQADGFQTGGSSASGSRATGSQEVGFQDLGSQTQDLQPDGIQISPGHPSLPARSERIAATSLADLLLRWGSLLSTLAHGTLDISISPRGAALVPATAEALERILVNLVTNARAATIAGGAIRIAVGSQEETQPETAGESPSRPGGTPPGIAPAGGRRCWTVLTVDDSGCGMSEAQVNRLFAAAAVSADGQAGGSAGDATASDEFRGQSPYSVASGQPAKAGGRQQGGEPAEPSVSRRQGLGLQVVRDLVAESGGTLSIQSRTGSGTRVEIRWPAATSAVQWANPDAAAANAHASGLGTAAAVEGNSRPVPELVPPAKLQTTPPADPETLPETVQPEEIYDAPQAAGETAARTEDGVAQAGGPPEPPAVGPDGFTEEQLRAMILRLHRTAPRDAGQSYAVQSQGTLETRAAGEVPTRRRGPLPSPLGRSLAGERAAPEGHLTHRYEPGIHAEIDSAPKGAIA